MAESHFERAVGSNSLDSAAYNNYGGFLCRQGRVEKAMKQFKGALKNPLNKAPEAALTNAGLCLMKNGRPDEAEKFFREGLVRNPRLPSALVPMIELSATKGRDLAARGYLQRYLEVGKHTSKTLWLGVMIERELGDRNAASSYEMLLKANYPDAPETRTLLESEPK
ncbi:MAG: tetratricopeptide repeat protein [Chromatiales bacterium]|nr:tetratricopeptide repeat protein [Chromatiales bacterium]